jgi:hypothetical protein
MRVFFFYTITFITSLLLLLFCRFYIQSIILFFLIIRCVIVFEFTFLSFFFYYLLKNKRKKIFFISVTIAFIAYSVYDYLSTSKSDFDYFPLVVESLFFLILIPYYFYEKMQFSIASPIYQSPDFWISVSFLIYFSGNFFLFLYTKVMSADPQFADQYNIIYDSFTILKDTLLCIAIFVNKSRSQNNKQFNIPISINLDIYKQN